MHYEWRGKDFAKKSELIAYVKDRVRELLGPPVSVRGKDGTAHPEWLALPRLEVELRSERRRRKASAVTKLTGPRTGKAMKKLPPIGDLRVGGDDDPFA